MEEEKGEVFYSEMRFSLENLSLGLSFARSNVHAERERKREGGKWRSAASSSTLLGNRQDTFHQVE